MNSSRRGWAIRSTALLLLGLSATACSSKVVGTGPVPQGDGGATPDGDPAGEPGRAGSMVATISDVASSNVDATSVVAASRGGARSIGGDYLEIEARSGRAATFTRSITLRINEGPGNTFRWNGVPGTLSLGPSSPVVLRFAELYEESGLAAHRWIAVGGSIHVDAVSSKTISFRLVDVTMAPDNRAASGTFALNGAARELAF